MSRLLICGIIGIGGGRDEYPLVQARCHYDVVDVYTIASLVQDYHSNADTNRDVEYVFPLPPSAAVCSFKAVINDKKTIKGIVKEKGEAKREYDKAVSQGKTAGLLQQEHADVFRVSLGNIKPKQKISVHISFVSIVPHDGSSPTTLRINMPTAIAPLYGTPPTNLPWSANIQNRFELTVAFQMSKPVTSLSSPTHPIGLTLGSTQRELIGDLQPTKAFVYLGVPSFLEKDIVIVVSAQGLDTPRCTVERWLTSDGAEEATDAYALTLVPKFDLPALPRQGENFSDLIRSLLIQYPIEYVFLVDRSGSMATGRMNAVKASLQIMLKSLPSRNTTFNIISFGSNFTSLWPNPRAYSAESVEEASQHVDTFSSNYGGTELRQALQYAFKSRAAHGKTAPEDKIPASVFVLTDGGSWDLGGVMEVVAASAEEAQKEGALLRIFVLGVGDEVATAMCEGIARAGKGTAVFVAEGEKPDAKLVSLLKAARGGVIEDLAVDWGVKPETKGADEDFEIVERPASTPAASTPTAAINLYEETTSSKIPELGPQKAIVQLAPPATIQQAPKSDKLPIPLYPGFRCSIFAIIKQPSNPGPPPQSVRITGNVLGRDVVLQIPVSPISVGSQAQAAVEGGRLVHTLVAKALIQRWEDLPTTPETKAEIERLGKRYTLASSVTSFLAIDEETKDVLEFALQPPPPAKISRSAESLEDESDDEMGFGLFGGDDVAFDYSDDDAYEMPTGSRRMPSSAVVALPGQSQSFLSSHHSDDVVHDQFLGFTFRRYAASASLPQSQSSLSAPQPSPHNAFQTLARAQNFDGSFPSTHQFILSLSLKGGQVPSLPNELAKLAGEEKLKEAIWATILTLACLQKQFGSEEEAWDILADKAHSFVNGSFEDLGLGEAQVQTVVSAVTAIALSLF